MLGVNGRCSCAVFLINREAQKLVDEGKCTIPLVHSYENHFIRNMEFPEETIGYNEEILPKAIEKCDFEIEDIEYGSWCDRTEYLSFQDIIIFRKNE